MEEEMQNGLSRRRLLRLGAAGVGAAAIGATGVNLLTASGAQAAYANHNEIGGAATIYEADGARRSDQYNTTFYADLEAWYGYWRGNVPGNWNTPAQIWNLGVFNDGRDSEAHNSGRGIDLTRIRATNDGGDWFWAFETYTRWRNRTGTELALARRRYWATAASLHREFRNVLTYPYNAAHHNHIHVDNLVYSPRSTPEFDTGSQAQVQHVQACLTYIWGYSTTIDGVYGAQTRSRAITAIERAGGEGDLLRGSNWVRFNTASFRKGVGTEAY